MGMDIECEIRHLRSDQQEADRSWVWMGTFKVRSFSAPSFHFISFLSFSSSGSQCLAKEHLNSNISEVYHSLQNLEHYHLISLGLWQALAWVWVEGEYLQTISVCVYIHTVIYVYSLKIGDLLVLKWGMHGQSMPRGVPMEVLPLLIGQLSRKPKKKMLSRSKRSSDEFVFCWLLSYLFDLFWGVADRYALVIFPTVRGQCHDSDPRWVMRKSSHVSCENYHFWVPRRSQATTPWGCKKKSMKHFQTWNGLSALRVLRTTPVSIETFAFHIWISLGHLWLMHPFQDVDYVDTYDILRSTLDTWKWTSTTTKTQVLQREILVCCRKFPVNKHR